MRTNANSERETTDPEITSALCTVVSALGQTGVCAAAEPARVDEYYGEGMVECQHNRVPMMDDLADALGFGYFTLAQIENS